MDALTEADVQKCLQMCVQLRAIIEEGIKKASEFQDKGRTCKSKSNGDVGKAIEFFRKQLKICEEVFYQVGVMEARTNLGNAYYDIGQYQNAIDCHRKVLEIAEERRDKHNAGVAYGNLANMYDSIGQYQMAIDCQQKALEIVKELGDRPGMGIILGNMGNSFKAIGQYQKAIDHYGEALKIAEEIGDKEGLCMTYTNIGSAYSSIGQYQKDIDYQLKALEIAKEIKHTADAGSAYGNLGSAYYSIGRYKEALNCHMENKTIAERLGNKPEVGRAYGNLGNVYLKMGDCQKALDYHSKDLEIAQELGDSQGIATARGNKGNALLASGKFQSAIECYKKQLISCEEIGDIPGVARTQLSLGLTYQWNDSKLACSHFAKSLLSFHRIRRSAVYPDESNTSLSNTFAGVHKRLVKSLLNLKKVKAALLVSDSGKAKALCDLTKRSVDVVMDSALDDKYTIPIQAISDNPCSTTTETLLDEVLSDVIRLMQDGSIISFSFDDLRGLHTWVISREGVCHKQWQTYNRMLGETYLKTIVDELQQSLVRKVPENFSAYPEEGKVPEFSDIDRKQGQEHTYVPVNNRDFSAKKCLDRYNLDNASRSQCSPYHSCAQEGEENQRNIQKLCGYFSLDVPDTARSSINRGSKLGTSLPKEYTPVDVYLQKLHSILIAPIEKYLIGSKVLIVPEGPLFRLPFSALLSPKEDRLCDTYSLQFTPALHVLNFCLSKPLPKLGPAMFVGNPAVGEVQFGNKRVLVPPLPNAAVEAKACSEYFTARPMLDENATKANVLKNMKHASVIHIAAHGHMDYADIFLAPNDGAPKPPSEEYYLLTAQDVVQCTLSARLVVLSCCHSGCGQVSAEGVVGIARSFLGAGARSVLVTLWQIPDKETMEFMKLFYDKVIQGLSVCVALQQAMLDLKKKYSISNWAPFQIAGEDICLSKDDIEEIRRQSSIRETNSEDEGKFNEKGHEIAVKMNKICVKEETTEDVETEEDETFCFLEPGLLRMKEEVRKKLESFPWLTGSYGITGPSRKIRTTHMFLTFKGESKKQEVIDDIKKKFGDDSINHIELLRERKKPPRFTFLSDDVAMNLNDEDDQNQSFFAVEPCGGISSEEPSSEEPSSEEPSSEEPCGGISSEEPCGGISSEEPCSGISSEEPCGRKSSEELCGGISAPTQEDLVKENRQSKASGTLTMLCTSDNSERHCVLALTCYHVGCIDSRVRTLDFSKGCITELHKYYTEDVNNEYSLVKRNEYFYHKRPEANTHDNDGDTTTRNDTNEGDSDEDSSNNNKKKVVDKIFVKANTSDDYSSMQGDKSWSSGEYSSTSDDNNGQSMDGNDGQSMDGDDGQSMNGNDGQRMDGDDGQRMDGDDGQSMDGNDGQSMNGNDGQSMDGNDGQKISLGKYCNGLFDTETDILSIEINNQDVDVDSSKFDVKFSKDREQLHREFGQLYKSEMNVTVEKNGYASNRTTGRLICPSYCHRESGKILFENMYVVERVEVPFFEYADSGALISWVNGEDIKHGFAYAVCDVDDIDLPRPPADDESEDESEDESDDESEDENDDESEDESDDESEDESEDESDDESEDESEDESDDESEDESEDKSDDEREDSSGSKCSDKSDDSISFSENVAKTENKPRNENGPYYLCHDIFTALDRLKLKPS